MLGAVKTAETSLRETLAKDNILPHMIIIFPPLSEYLHISSQFLINFQHRLSISLLRKLFSQCTSRLTHRLPHLWIH